jgi:hypothetical protein
MVSPFITISFCDDQYGVCLPHTGKTPLFGRSSGRSRALALHPVHNPQKPQSIKYYLFFAVLSLFLQQDGLPLVRAKAYQDRCASYLIKLGRITWIQA